MRHASQSEGTVRRGLYRNTSLAILSVFFTIFLFRSSNDVLYSLGLDEFAGPRVTHDGQTMGGAQGNSAGSCRMTWMNPSYLPIRSVKSKFNSKYSLYLYRELGWDLEQDPSRSPVLFIPGNAGSFRQVRSLAAVTATTYFQSPQSPRPDYLRRHHPGLDFFTLDFNNEFSAFHGQTLVQQAEFANDAMRAILSMYQQSRLHTNTHLPGPSSVLIIGHSMGGVLARKMLTMPNYVNNSINTIISLSSPHSIPPITFEAGIESVYQSINRLWREAFTRPIAHNHSPLQEIVLVSIAGGSSDTTVSSDSSSLLSLAPSASSLTAFTTGIPGVWTPIDHLAILWCNQLAMVTAKALLQMTEPLLPAQVGPAQRRLDILISHLIRGHGIEPFPLDINGALQKFHVVTLPTNPNTYQLHSQFQPLRLTQADLNADSPRLKTHIIPLPEHQPPGLEFTLLSTLVANHRLNVLACRGTFETQLLQACSSISAFEPQLLPQSRFNLTPVAAPGPYDQADPPLVSSFIQVPLARLGKSDFIAIQVYTSASSYLQDDKSDFLISEFRNVSASTISATDSFVKFCLFGASFRLLPTGASLVSEVQLPSLISSLLAFKLDVKRGSQCDAQGLFAPLMRQETPLINESKFHPNIRSAVLSTHFSRAYTPIRILSTEEVGNVGVRLTFWLDPFYCGGGTGGESHSIAIRIKLDWYETIRRIVLRYRTALVSCPLALLSLVFWIQLRQLGQTGSFISFNSAVSHMIEKYLAKILYSVAVLQFFQSFLLKRSSHHQQLKSEFTLIDVPHLISDLLLGQAEWLFVILNWVIILASIGWTTAAYFFLETVLRFIALVWIKLVDTLFPQKQNYQGIHPKRTEFPSPAGLSSGHLRIRQSRKKLMTLLLLVALGISNILFAPYHFTFIVLTLLHFFNTAQSSIDRLRPLLRSEKSIDLINESERKSRHHCNMSILLIMIWLLPISTTTLLVWLRNLQEGNYEPFCDGRNLGCVIGFMSLVYLLDHHNHLQDDNRNGIAKLSFKFTNRTDPSVVDHPRQNLKHSPEIPQPKHTVVKLLKKFTELIFFLLSCLSISHGIRYTFWLFYLFNLAFLSLSMLIFLSYEVTSIV